MTWFTATSVAVNNGQTVVSVNAGDDIQLAQESGGLIIGNNPPVEIKRSYLDGSNNKKIELRSAWPYANQAAQPAVAFPTDGDLAAATAVLKQLIDGFALATQSQAEQGTNNTAAMTALRVKQAIDFFRPLTTSATDSTAGRMLKVGDFGIGATGNTTVFSGDIGLIQSTGLYSGGPSTTGGPANVSLDGAKIFHKKWADPNSATQTVHTYSGSSYERHITGGIQLPWKMIFDSRNILGTVSQASGIPTGAIIQRGSNANGEFFRFADGTQICTQRLASFSLSGNTTSPTLNWIYPISFSAQPQSFITPALSFSDSADPIIGWGDTSPSDASSATRFLIRSLGSSSITVTPKVTAIGRWF